MYALVVVKREAQERPEVVCVCVRVHVCMCMSTRAGTCMYVKLMQYVHM